MSYPTGTIDEIDLYSYSLAEEITMLVYLPPGYTPLTKYPILIAQDGKDYFQFGKVGRAADELIAKNEVSPFIFVGIPYKSVEDRWQKYHPNGEQNEAYIRFLAHELIPFLDDEFPTLQVGMGRAFAGDSLGATVSLLTSLQYPNIVGKLILQSPYVDEKVIEKVNEAESLAHLTIYHTIGKQETEVKTTDKKIKDFLTPNRELSNVLSQKQLTYHYHEFEGGHFWRYWQADMKNALLKIFSE